MIPKSNAGSRAVRLPLSGWNYPPQALHRVDVLAVSLSDADQRTLSGLFDHTRWVLHRAASLKDACSQLVEAPSPVILVSRHLPDGEWTDLVDAIHPVPDCPRIIVVAETLDSEIYESVLRRGAYDVIATPFEAHLLYPMVSDAWMQWKTGRMLASVHVAPGCVA